MKKLFLITLVSLGLYSCKEDSTIQDEGYVTKIYTQSKLPIVKVKINGVDKFLLLDTGASFTSIHTKTVTDVGGVIGELAPINAEGFGGTENKLYDTFRLKLKIIQE